MHNGGIAEFPKLKRRLQSTLPDEIYDIPNGNTGSSPFFFFTHPYTSEYESNVFLLLALDSEWAFALFLSKV